MAQESTFTGRQDQNSSRNEKRSRNIRKTLGESGGKLPPQSVELEEAVLGAILLEKKAIDLVVDILEPRSFYLEKHQAIFQGMLDIFRSPEQEPIDYITLSEQLRKNGTFEKAGSTGYLVKLTRKMRAGTNVEAYARKLTEYSIRRELLEISYEVQRKGYEDSTDAFELLDEMQQDLFEVSEKSMRKSYARLKDAIQESLDELQAKKDQKDGLIGVPSGFPSLDARTNGWQKSNLIILAARPGMGKTSLVLNMVRNAAVEFNRPIAFFSLEMSKIELTNRLLAIEAEIDSSKLSTGKMSKEEWERLFHKANKIKEAPIFFDDTPNLNVTELRAKCRRLKNQANIEMVILDYLQLMSGSLNTKQGNREQEISLISRSLKQLAKELEVPVIALSQLSRAVEARQDKRPQLSDLRESGAIEQDADMVAFLYRPAYYKIETMADGTPTENLTEIIIEKFRNGQTGVERLRFLDRYTKFVDWDDDGDFSGFSPMSKLPDDPDGSSFFQNEGSITIPSKMNSKKDKSANSGDDQDNGFGAGSKGMPEDEEDAPF